MADIIQKSTEYRIKQIELAEANYYKELTKALDRIERRVISLADTDLPRQEGKLIELQAAIAIRPKIKAILDQEYLPFADRVVWEGFTKQAKRIEKAFKRIGNIPPEFQELTKGDLALVQSLKQQYFTQFKDVSNTFTRKLSEQVYQNTLVGNTFTELEKELRQSINGIYASSDDKEAQKLINYINNNKFKKSKQTSIIKRYVLPSKKQMNGSRSWLGNVTQCASALRCWTITILCWAIVTGKLVVIDIIN